MREKHLFAWLFLILPYSSLAAEMIPLRIMAANLTSGNHQTYDLGEGMRIMKGLKPDVVLLQEFHYKSDSPKDIRKFVDATFGPEWSYHRESIEGDIPGPLPNGVLSRYPILEQGEWEDPIAKNRDFTWARIDIPSEHKLWAISVHLKASNDSASRRKREEEAKALVDLIKEKVPAGDYVVMGGDFNTYNLQELALAALKEVVSEEAQPENPIIPVSHATNMTGRYPYDHVLASEELRKLMVPVSFPSDANKFPDGLIFDSTTFTPLSLVPGVLQGDSRAPGIQHLAVIKDFFLPPVPVQE